jgi:uncharacterized protein (UPF0332 family)
MKEHDLNQLIENRLLLNEKIQGFMAEGVLTKQKADKAEISGHLMKSDHNLRFVQENIRIDFLDWAITGCYYACYHAALALIMTKDYYSKNHLATLAVLIREFYQKGLTKEDIETLSDFLDYQDVLFYVESKNRREEAMYSSKIRFTKEEANMLRIKAVLFVSKLKAIIHET